MNCIVENCKLPVKTKFLCKRHYRKLLRYGNPTGGWNSEGLTNSERFWKNVFKTDECWEWRGHRNKGGYGVFSCNGGQILAHRFAFEEANHINLNGKYLDHLCRNRACVRPSHLEIVDLVTNTKRGKAGELNAQRIKSLNQCRNGHPYTPENTYLYKGKRNCRKCRTLATERYIQRCHLSTSS